jgi:Undecaprenyl-phosphate glucose phosphotransferase
MDMQKPLEAPRVVGFSTSISASEDCSASAPLRPQHLALLSLIVDLFVFLMAGALAWVSVSGAASELLHVVAGSTAALALLVFIACNRAARVHDPLVLLHAKALPRLLKSTLCAAAPLIVPMTIAIPLLGTGEPEAHLFGSWLVSFEVNVIVLSLAAHGLFQIARPALSRRVFAAQRIAVVGSGESAARLLNWIDSTAPGLFRIIGVYDDRDRNRIGVSSVAERVVGTTADLIERYKSQPFDKVVIALPHSAEARLLHLLRALRRLPVDIVLAPDVIGFTSANQNAAEASGLRLLSLAHRPIREPQRVLKACIDITAAGLALLALSPILIAIVVAIKLDSEGPVLFRQRRQGLGDRLFDVFKFRTMYCDLGDPHGEHQTKRSDPRVTRIGNFLRRTSLDELPQLLNVLRGEMSLVGPRPHTPHMLIGDKRHFEIVAEYSWRHRVKPGITGLAQVSGYRGAVDTPDHLKARIDLDLYYIDHWSLWMDIKILFRTALVCATGLNAF